MNWVLIVYFCLLGCFGVFVLIKYIQVHKKYKNIDNKQSEYNLLVSEHMALFGPLATEKILVQNLSQEEKVKLLEEDINKKI